MWIRILLFFFFKQKTAYEIYQCDWSSDVCSSDLVNRLIEQFNATQIGQLAQDPTMAPFVKDVRRQLRDRKSVV